MVRESFNTFADSDKLLTKVIYLVLGLGAKLVLIISTWWAFWKINNFWIVDTQLILITRYNFGT